MQKAHELDEAIKLNLAKIGYTIWADTTSDGNNAFNEDTAKEIVQNIVNWYYKLFLDFKDKMANLQDK